MELARADDTVPLTCLRQIPPPFSGRLGFNSRRIVPRVNANIDRSRGAMADDERSAAAGQNDPQAQATAEADGGNDRSPHGVAPIIAPEITPQSPVQAETETRRTSMSSRAGDNMQASQQSLQSGTGTGVGVGVGEGSERAQPERQPPSRDSQRRNRPTVARLDYGTLLLHCEREIATLTGIQAQCAARPAP